MKKADISDQEYNNVHAWLRYHYGKPQSCEQCGATERKLAWAFVRDKVYAKDKESFIGLCYSCHMRYDWGDTCAQGHPYSEENTYWYKTMRQCKLCNRTGRRIHRINHHAQHAAYQRKSRQKSMIVKNRLTQSLCVDCGKPASLLNKRLCEPHRLRMAQYAKDFKLKRKLTHSQEDREGKEVAK